MQLEIKGKEISTILAVAQKVLGDVDELNWGRIATMFFFASHICVKVKQ